MTSSIAKLLTAFSFPASLQLLLTPSSTTVINVNTPGPGCTAVLDWHKHPLCSHQSAMASQLAARTSKSQVQSLWCPRHPGPHFLSDNQSMVSITSALRVALYPQALPGL